MADALAALLMKKKPAMPVAAPSDDEAGGGEDLTAAAQEVLDAVKAEDAGALASALRAFCELADNDSGTE